MITNKLTFTVFALIVLFPIYFGYHFSLYYHYQILKLYIMKLLKILSLVCLSISIGACAEHSMSRAKNKYNSTSE